MEKVSYQTDHLLVKANTDSDWDDCTFAIIYLSNEWRKLLAERSAWIEVLKRDSSFFALSFWDTNVDFFSHTGDQEEDPLYGSDLLGKQEQSSYVTVGPEEIDRFKRPQNEIRGFQLKLAVDGILTFHAHGDYTGERFYTEGINTSVLLSTTLQSNFCLHP